MQIWPAEDQAATTVQLSVAHFRRCRRPSVSPLQLSGRFDRFQRQICQRLVALIGRLFVREMQTSYTFMRQAMMSHAPTPLTAPAHTSTCRCCTQLYKYVYVCLHGHERTSYLHKQIFMRICILALCQSVSGNCQKSSNVICFEFTPS